MTVKADMVRFAGAISSVRYDGFEYVNKYDHGRELQSAVSFDGRGECWNPTEAGSRADGTRSGSTSEFMGHNLFDSGFSARTMMASWLKPGATSPSCPGGAVNPYLVSPHVLDKTVSLGAGFSDHVIRHDITFEVNESHTSAVFEALTLYTPASLDEAWTYDPRTRALKHIAFPQAEQVLPVILSSTDELRATGVWSPGLPQPAYQASGYGAWYFSVEKTAKWNCVYRMSDIVPGDYSFTAYSIFGTLSEVTAAMNALYAGAN